MDMAVAAKWEAGRIAKTKSCDNGIISANLLLDARQPLLHI
jgi:hypothetical protein